MKLYKILTIFLIFTLPCLSQIKPTTSAGMGYSLYGTNRLDIEDLNTSLKNNGYTKFSTNFFCVGGGGHGLINDKWIIGGEGQTLLGEDKVRGNYKSSIYAASGFVNLGYIVYELSGLKVYPLIGIGAGGLNFSISQDLNSLSFNEILDDPERSVQISTSEFLIQVSLGVDYLLTLAQDEDGQGGLVFGLRAGYCLSPFQSDWMMGDLQISGAPETGMTGPYIRFMFGGFGGN